MSGARLMRAVAAMLAAAMLVLSPAVQALEPVPYIDAKEIVQDGKVFEAEGDVVIQRDDGTLKADRVRYDTESDEAVAEGNVVIEDSETRVTARRVEMNMRTNIGVLYDSEVFFKEGGYRLLGPVINKTGEDRYFLRVGSITTCKGVVQDWCLKGRNVDVIVGDRLKAWHATLNVRNVPVSYTPYYWASLLNKRTTGFLQPKMGYSDKKGFIWRQPFFWAISENRDATILADLYTSRGLGLGLEYRYIEAPGIAGSINLYHIRDSKFSSDFRELRAKHRHRQGAFKAFYDINLVSRFDFYRQYEPYLPQSSYRFLQSQAEVSAWAGPARFYVRGLYAQDLRDSTDEALLIQKMPEAGAFLAPRRLGPVLLVAEAAVADFVSKKARTDGRRIDGALTVSHSMGRGLVLSQILGLKERYYALNGSTAPYGDAQRSFGVATMDYRVELRESFGRKYKRVQHIVMPSLAYNYVWAERKSAPTFDSKEFVSDLQRAEFKLVNRFYDYTGEFLTVRLTDSYDFNAVRKPLAPAALDWRYKRGAWTLTGNLSYDWHESWISSSNSRVELQMKRGKISGGHSFGRSTGTTFNFELNYQLTEAIALNSDLWYDSGGEGITRLKAGVQYNSQCWVMSLDYIERPREYQIYLTITLKGFGDILFEHSAGDDDGGV